MKRAMPLLLLLSACALSEYEYRLTWTCLSPEGCERAEDVALLDRLNTYGDSFFFKSRTPLEFTEHAQRVASEEAPAGCFLLHGFTLFGHELAPSALCSTPDGYDLELAIPNRNPTTSSQWLIEIREL